MPTTDRKGRVKLLPQEALSTGRRWWIALLVVASAGLVSALAARPASELSSGLSATLGGVLVGLAMAWLVLLGGAVLVLRGYCFRAMWDGRPVEPGSYLKGMYQVWGVLVIGGLLAVLGALLMGAVLPGVLIVLVCLMLLVFARPNGKALGL